MADPDMIAIVHERKTKTTNAHHARTLRTRDISEYSRVQMIISVLILIATYGCELYARRRASMNISYPHLIDHPVRKTETDTIITVERQLMTDYICPSYQYEKSRNSTTDERVANLRSYFR